jgi:predicted enzyme involved in methoxymalonyl-ACP biosynthesis
MGTSLDSLSALASAHAEAEAIKFLEPMDEYSRMIASIKTAMSQRQSKKDSYVLAMNDYESKQASYRKLVGVPGKEAQAKQKEQAMDTAKEAYENAKTEYERVTERLLIEFESFKSQRSLDMKEIVVDFISLQVPPPSTLFSL